MTISSKQLSEDFPLHYFPEQRLLFITQKLHFSNIQVHKYKNQIKVPKTAIQYIQDSQDAPRLLGHITTHLGASKWLQQHVSRFVLTQVAIRCRPLNQKQLLLSDFKTIKILDKKMVVLLDPGNQFQPQDIFRKNRNKQMQYAFDFAFDESSSNQQIYSSTTSFLIDGVLDGFNATIFAYGATGCGKTFTMVGDQDNLGVMPRCLNDLFQKVSMLRLTKDVKIKLSYMEIYNQYLKDLLISQDRNFEVREDPKSGIVISGISQVPVNNMLEINTLLKVGNRNRSKQATGANEASSRSHAILQVSVQSQELSDTNNQIKSSKVSLVDLAGSERASATSNRGQRMVEGAKINQSLLILGNCIQALSQATQKGRINSFVPYRGSKLTRLLKDSLGGNCRTVMIANVSPSVSSFEDSYNTLMYANRAKAIKTNAHRNVLNVQNHLNSYTNIINTLKKQNNELKFLLIKNQENNCILPKINGTEQVTLMEKLEKILKSHFSEHQSLIKQLSQIQQQIDKQGFYILKLQIQSQKQKLSNQKVLTSKKLIQSYNIKKQQLEKNIKLKQSKLANIVIDIKSSDLTTSHQSYLLSLIKQQEIILQKQQMLLVERKLQNQTKQKGQIIVKLKQQISQRDKTIEQHKVLIEKKKIIHRITYSSLKNHTEVEIKPKNTLPKVSRHRSVRRIFDDKMKSLDISVLDTSIQKAEEIKLNKKIGKDFKSINVGEGSKRHYYNKHIQKQMKINQYRQNSAGNISTISPSKKKVDYLNHQKEDLLRKQQKRKEKTELYRNDFSQKFQQRQHNPNPLYMRRRKFKY